MIYASLKERLNNQHKTIAALIINLNSEQLTKRPARSIWNIHENIAHLAKYQPVFIDRVHEILTLDEPVFEVYNAAIDIEFEIYCAFSIYELIKKISHDRELIYNLIMPIPAEKLQRTGVHPEYGSLTILEWTEFFLLHEAHHLYTIFQLAHGVRKKAYLF